MQASTFLIALFAGIAVFAKPVRCEQSLLRYDGQSARSGFLRIQQDVDLVQSPARVFTVAELAKKDLELMWQSLKKDTSGRIGVQSLTYLVRRIMLRSYGLTIVGLDASFNNNTTAWVAIAALGWAPARRYSLEDVVEILAALNQYLEHSSVKHLQELYRLENVHPNDEIDTSTMVGILQRFFFELMMGGTTESIDIIRENKSMVELFVDNHNELADFVRGVVVAYQTHHRGLATARHQWNPFRNSFSFDDSCHLAGDIIRSFGEYWSSECRYTKDRLLLFDFHAAGRVKLSDFHGAALDGEWRFSESKAYLQSLGAMDRSSHGQPSVIISNYVQSVSNCIASSDTFRVCCFDECESHLAVIEQAVGGPYGSPAQLIEIVEGITIDLDDGQPAVSSTLRAQLEEIAKKHGGQVLLHSRLFAQWLHFVMPRDCPYPYKTGSVLSMPPVQFGDDCVATQFEMQQHVANASVAVNVTDFPSKLLEQWDTAEELYSGEDLVAPWQVHAILPKATYGVAVCVFLGMICLLLPARQSPQTEVMLAHKILI